MEKKTSSDHLASQGITPTFDVVYAMEAFASQETASLKAENEELKKKLDFEIQVAEGQLAINKELTVEAIEIEAEITALKSEVERLREGLKVMIEEFSRPDYEVWCDHLVGICSCNAIKTIEQAKELLNSKQPKP